METVEAEKGKKWTAVAVSNRAWTQDMRRAKELLNQLFREPHMMVEIRGITEKPETHERTTFMQGFIPTCGAGHPIYDMMRALGEKYHYTLSKETAPGLVADLPGILEEAKKNRPEKDCTISQAKHDEQTAAAEERDQREREKARARDLMAGRVKEITPAWAGALIVAELRVDDSDGMTDYFASHAESRILIGFRSGSREDFSQLHRAAGQYEQTKHLGPQTGKEVEHRDNYSMGAGNYLQAGHGGHNSGWRVRSYGLNEGGRITEIAECATNHNPAPAESVQAAGGITLTRNLEKNGLEIRFPERPADGVLALLKSHGWRWSRFSSCWYVRHTPEQETFAQELIRKGAA